MKNKIPLLMAASMLILAVLACQLPERSTATPERTLDLQTQPVTETLADVPSETSSQIVAGTATTTSTTTPTPGLPVYNEPVIFKLHMFSPLDGWSVTQDGNKLLRTEDGGRTWLDATPVGLDPASIGMATLSITPFFRDALTAWFTPFNPSGGMLYRTLDGGLTWDEFPVPFDNASYYFLDLSMGYGLVSLGAGAGSHYVALYRTVDGGMTWTEVFSHEPGESKSLPESGTKNGITFSGVDYGWIGGTIPMTDYFYLHYTEDGGITWSLETDIALPETFSNVMLDVWQPIFINASTAYLPVRALGVDSESYLLIYRSNDYGQTWTFQNFVEDGRTVDFISVEEGWIAGDLALYHTVDGGITWSSVPAAGIPAGTYFINIDFVDEQHGWTLTTPDNSTWEPLIFYRTTDGGANWEQLLP